MADVVVKGKAVASSTISARSKRKSKKRVHKEKESSKEHKEPHNRTEARGDSKSYRTITMRRKEFETKEAFIHQRFKELLENLDRKRKEILEEEEKMIEVLRSEYAEVLEAAEPDDVAKSATCDIDDKDLEREVPLEDEPRRAGDDQEEDLEKRSEDKSRNQRSTMEDRIDRIVVKEERLEEIYSNEDKLKKTEEPESLRSIEKGKGKEKLIDSGESNPNLNVFNSRTSTMQIKNLLLSSEQIEDSPSPFDYTRLASPAKGSSTTPTSNGPITSLKRKRVTPEETRDITVCHCVKHGKHSAESSSLPNKKQRQQQDEPESPTRTSYVFFSSRYFPIVAEKYPELDFHTQVLIVEQHWKKLSAEEKKRYDTMALKEKERWDKELAAYEEQKTLAFRCFRLQRFSLLASQNPGLPSERILDLLREEWEDMNGFQKAQYLLPLESAYNTTTTTSTTTPTTPTTPSTPTTPQQPSRESVEHGESGCACASDEEGDSDCGCACESCVKRRAARRQRGSARSPPVCTCSHKNEETN